MLQDRAYLLTFDAIHASPPCQAYSAMSNCRPGLAEEYPDLVEPTRDALPPDAPVAGSPLCGARYLIEPGAWACCVLHDGHDGQHRSGRYEW